MFDARPLAPSMFDADTHLQYQCALSVCAICMSYPGSSPCMTQSPRTAEKSPRTKKKTWRNTRKYSATSAYLLTSHSENPNCSLSSHPTTIDSRKRLSQPLTSADNAIVRTSIRHGKLPSCEKPLLTDLLSSGLAFVGSTLNALCRIMAAFFLPLGLDGKLHPAKRRMVTLHFDTSERSSLDHMLLATVTR
jgi:hypothetical protein